jgi:hypothetical protein
MRLLEIFDSLAEESLQHLVERFLGPGESTSTATQNANLESALRSPKHVRDTVYDLQPPTFRILSRLLDADAHSIPASALRDSVMEETSSLASAVTSGAILRGDETARLYRRVFLEARRNDLSIDPSEAAILGVLRRELQIPQVEHFLIEHHQDFWTFWRKDHAFLEAMRTLQEQGIVFIVAGAFVLADELVPFVRQVLGLELGAAATRRLYTKVRNEGLADILANSGLKVGGNKEERLQRLIDNYVQPTAGLTAMSLPDLKELAKDCGLVIGGNKEDLVERIVGHFASGEDIKPAEAPPPPPPPEERELSPERFELLFAALRVSEISDILAGIGSKRLTGTREQLTRLVRESRFNEVSLVSELDGKQLDAVLAREKLKVSGLKAERVRRLVERFGAAVASSFPGDSANTFEGR